MQDLLLKHEKAVAQYLSTHYEEVRWCSLFYYITFKWITKFLSDIPYLLLEISKYAICQHVSCSSIDVRILFQFFEHYDKLLASPNYVTRRQSLKVRHTNNQHFASVWLTMFLLKWTDDSIVMYFSFFPNFFWSHQIHKQWGVIS